MIAYAQGRDGQVGGRPAWSARHEIQGLSFTGVLSLALRRPRSHARAEPRPPRPMKQLCGTFGPACIELRHSIRKSLRRMYGHRARAGPGSSTCIVCRHLNDLHAPRHGGKPHVSGCAQRTLGGELTCCCPAATALRLVCRERPARAAFHGPAACVRGAGVVRRLPRQRAGTARR